MMKLQLKKPMLRFSPAAWAKLQYLRDRGDSEVGGFGVAHGDDLLRVDDVVLVEQTCSPVTVAFSDASVADYFEQQVEASQKPAQFARVWIHTHPGDSAHPSAVDEETFARVFGGSDFAVMFILARGGDCYARLQFNAGPGGALELDVNVDFSEPFAASDHAAWEREYLANVNVLPPAASLWLDDVLLGLERDTPKAWCDAWHAYTDEEIWERFAHERV